MTRRAMAMTASGRFRRETVPPKMDSGKSESYFRTHFSGSHSAAISITRENVWRNHFFLPLAVIILPLHPLNNVANIRLNLTKITPNTDNCTSSWTKLVVSSPSCRKSSARRTRQSWNTRWVIVDGLVLVSASKSADSEETFEWHWVTVLIFVSQEIQNRIILEYKENNNNSSFKDKKQR